MSFKKIRIFIPFFLFQVLSKMCSTIPKDQKIIELLLKTAKST